MDYKKLLNDKQYEAVSTEAKYVRIVAGAGSGKTRTLTYRISYLITELGVRPRNILGFTFTNKAAAEMKERAIRIIEENYNETINLQLSTFHSFCARFLRQEINVLNYPTNFQIIDEEDQLQLVKNICADKGLKKNDPLVKYSLNFICNKKCYGEYPQDIKLGKDDDEEDKFALEVYEKYQERLEAMVKVDFDDLLNYTIYILSSYSSIRDKWQRKYQHILIDEFQDTNDVQFKLVNLLMNENTHLYVVGDPDQTIYTWRGANQDIIIKFDLTFPGAETIILNENYRSTTPILDCANKLIAHNKKRVPKDLFTNNRGGVKVDYHFFMNAYREAKNIADQIESLRRIDPTLRYSDFAVLYRAAYLTRPVEQELVARRLPYVIFGGTKFFQRAEIKDVLAYFNLIYNSKDDLSFKRIVNIPTRGIGDKTLSILTDEKTALNLSYYDYLLNIDNYETELKTKAVIALTTMVESIEKVRRDLAANLEAYPAVLQKFIEDIGYFVYLKEDEDKGAERIMNVQALFDDILHFVAQNPDSPFEEYLENAALQSAQDEVDNGDHISLMTIHVAKGLEFKVVFVIGLTEGIFPSDRTTLESGEKGLEEERRLCYVAFTRAKERLFVSAQGGFSYILNQDGQESRFIQEAGLGKPLPSNKKPDAFQSKYTKPSPAQKAYKPDVPFFDDILKEEKETISIPKMKENGITDWDVGDKINHDKFGKGVVTKVISDTMIEIEFVDHGKKTLFSSNAMIHRIKGELDA